VAVTLSGNGQTTITLATFMPTFKTIDRELTNLLSIALQIKLQPSEVSMPMPLHHTLTLTLAIFQVLLMPVQYWEAVVPDDHKFDNNS
jgi:hypothetical protein